MDIESLFRECYDGRDELSVMTQLVNETSTTDRDLGVGLSMTSSDVTADGVVCNMSIFENFLRSGAGRNLIAVDGLPDAGEFDAVKRPALAGVVIGVYVAVLLVGVFGNGLVFITVAKNPLMRTSTNIFIANLALADIFVCAFDLPLNLYYQLADDWIFGSILCHVIPAVFGVVVCASTLTLTVIAADRFALIVIGIRQRMSPGVALILVAVIAAISTLMSLPVAVFSRLETIFIPELGINRRYCFEVWPSGLRQFRHLYTVGTVLVQHFLPLIVIAVLYMMIFRRVRASRKQSGRQRVVSNTNRMLVAVVAVFAIAWTPYQLFSVVSEIRSDLVKGPYFRFIDLMLRVVAMASSGLNPILYGWMNANFRSAFLGCLRRRSHPVFAGNSVVVGGDKHGRARRPVPCVDIEQDQDQTAVCMTRMNGKAEDVDVITTNRLNDGNNRDIDD